MKRLFTLPAVLTFVSGGAQRAAETVHFQSLDGKTMLVAHLFQQANPANHKATEDAMRRVPRTSFLNICSIKRSRYTPKMHVEP